MQIYGQLKNGGKTLVVTAFDSDGRDNYQRTQMGENVPGEPRKLVNLAVEHVKRVQMERARERYEQVNAGDSK